MKRFLLVLVVAAGIGGCSTADLDTIPPDQASFATPEEAVRVLAAGLEAEDLVGLKAIFGRGADDLLSSGDPIADREARRRFLRLSKEKSRLEPAGEDAVMIHLGELDWPFPIPVVKVEGRWLFDTESGKEEILDRRIGKNELDAMQVCLAYVDAQREYWQGDRDGDGLLEYAQRFASTPGRKDGLYWPTTEAEEPSPLGVLAARAALEGYTAKRPGEEPSPYHGYHYRILTAQGKHAPGGDYDYLVNGNMIGGFALIAYPAEHGSSGVMTFLVNHQGVVYQKDLGKNTGRLAARVKAFDPDQTWSRSAD